MIGYSNITHGYNVYDIEKNRIIGDRSDCIFDPNLVESIIKSGTGNLNKNSDEDSDEDQEVSDENDIFIEVNEPLMEDEEHSDNMEELLSIVEEIGTEDKTYMEWSMSKSFVEEKRDEFIQHCLIITDKNIILPPAPKNEMEALSENNPDREKWIEAIMNELKLFESYKSH